MERISQLRTILSSERGESVCLYGIRHEDEPLTC